MTFRAGQPRTLNMDRMREPDILRLLRIHQPRSLVPGLDVVIYQSGLGRGLADPLRVTPGTLLRGRNSGKGAVVAKCVALVALRDAGLFSVRLVEEIERLMFLHIQQARKYKPSREQCNCQPESEDNRVARQLHCSITQSVLEKKCWNKPTRCCRGNNCATPCTGAPPSQPGAWVS